MTGDQMSVDDALAYVDQGGERLRHGHWSIRRDAEALSALAGEVVRLRLEVGQQLKHWDADVRIRANEIDRLEAENARLRAELQQAFAIAGWHECRLAIARRDGWECLPAWEESNPIPGAGNV